MLKDLTKEQFIEILDDKEIMRPNDLAIFQIIYQLANLGFRNLLQKN